MDTRGGVPFSFEKVFWGTLYFIDTYNTNNNPIGLTTLGCLWYFADFDHYEKYGEGISGMEYIKASNGPQPRELRGIVRQMIEHGNLGVDKDYQLVVQSLERWEEPADYQI